jgi:hypothetical protein
MNLILGILLEEIFPVFVQPLDKIKIKQLLSIKSEYIKGFFPVFPTLLLIYFLCL